MVFGTLEIWLLLPLAILLYYAMPVRFKWSVLLIGSMLYLGYYSIPFLIYATIYAVANFFFGKILYPIADEKKRKRIYLLFLIVNIGQLVVYKYTNFLLENLNWAVSSLSGKEIPYLNILVPIGISYYTFQCIGYIVNINRKHEKPETHLGHFIIYNLFFPKILSGPIERSERFLPQIKNPQPFSSEVFKGGFRLILFGLMYKLIIAERLSVVVTNVYGHIENYKGVSLIIVFSVQMIYLYTDFCGYTNIALGIAKLFGINLTDNFNRPFFSRNVSEYWRRWHISLSSWCNDYIFKTIIFKRRRWGQNAAVYGVFVTFLIVGIWHGAMWTFVIIGLLQGLAINYEFFTRRRRTEIGSKIPVFWNNTVSRMITYIFASFTHIFFFSHSIGDAAYFLKNMFHFDNAILVGNNLGLVRKEFVIAIIAIIIAFFFEILAERKIDVLGKLKSKPGWVQWIVYYVLLFILIMFGKFATTNFIYFQF
jgi:alginate O-acetyltransferase complex protein AlgI